MLQAELIARQLFESWYCLVAMNLLPAVLANKQ